MIARLDHRAHAAKALGFTLTATDTPISDRLTSIAKLKAIADKKGVAAHGHDDATGVLGACARRKTGPVVYAVVSISILADEATAAENAVAKPCAGGTLLLFIPIVDIAKAVGPNAGLFSRLLGVQKVSETLVLLRTAVRGVRRTARQVPRTAPAMEAPRPHTVAVLLIPPTVMVSPASISQEDTVIKVRDAVKVGQVMSPYHVTSRLF